jgi:hypothetical protein
MWRGIVSPWRGWVIKVTSPGVSSETRPIVEVMAVSIAEADDALRAVQERTGGVADALYQLSDELLTAIGLTEEGQFARIQCIF